MNTSEWFALKFHHGYCLFCRRFARQIELLQGKAREMNDRLDQGTLFPDSPSYQLSPQTRNRISKLLRGDERNA